MLLIDIIRIPDEGKNFAGEIAPVDLELNSEAYFDFKGAVFYDLRVQLVSNEAIITGKTWLDVLFRCSKCDEPFELRIEDLEFSRVCEISGNTESVDLTADIREAILLAFPSYAVCEADCRGLCSQCGCNLNKESCKCEEPRDARWSGLDGLNIS